MSDYDSGYMDGKAVMYERIAELEQENARLRSQIAADKKQAYAEGIKEGMERSAEIAYELGWGSVATAIRKEIEK